MLEELKTLVCQANMDLVRHGLVTLSWGNASGIDPERALVVIKPSGISYDRIEPRQMVVVDLDGNLVEGDLQPSSDMPTHVLLYRHFEGIGGITHTHSTHATTFAQARMAIPCLGTTHADHFFGPVPVTRPLSREEVETDYETGTGRVIVERFAQINPTEMPAVLVAGHGPFTWGATAAEAVSNAAALEAVARMAAGTMAICSDPPPLEPYILEKHYQRKHGPDAYYGQKT
jgi:L-ribulose-5-phosphate 4-epimerase